MIPQYANLKDVSTRTEDKESEILPKPQYGNNYLLIKGGSKKEFYRYHPEIQISKQQK